MCRNKQGVATPRGKTVHMVRKQLKTIIVRKESGHNKQT